MNYLSLNQYLKDTFGCKVYKLAIDGGFTCPNRDGTLGTRGCIFCSGLGSGDFAQKECESITRQIENAKARVSNKIKEGKYIAYFQAFTNTYAPVNVLKKKFSDAINHPDVVTISIGTRPDCISDEILDLLSELNKIKPVWIELGLQTIHEATADFIRRGYDLPVYDKVVYDLKARGIYVITHIILGLPGESEDMMLRSVEYICNERLATIYDASNNQNINVTIPATDGIKLQLLHIIKGTDLATLYEYYCCDNMTQLDSCSKDSFERQLIEENKTIMENFHCLSIDKYVSIIEKCIEIIPNNIAVHRLTGDGDKRTLIAPMWSTDKKRVLNTISSAINR